MASSAINGLCPRLGLWICVRNEKKRRAVCYDRNQLRSACVMCFWSTANLNLAALVRAERLYLQETIECTNMIAAEVGFWQFVNGYRPLVDRATFHLVELLEADF
jgi:hypothetical protein